MQEYKWVLEVVKAAVQNAGAICDGLTAHSRVLARLLAYSNKNIATEVQFLALDCNVLLNGSSCKICPEI